MDGFALVVGWLTIALIGVGVAMLAAFAAAEWLNGREQPGDDGLEHESGEAVERLAETPAVREWNADGWHHDPEHDAQAHFYYQDGELAGEVVEVEDGSFRPIVYGGPEYSERGDAGGGAAGGGGGGQADEGGGCSGGLPPAGARRRRTGEVRGLFVRIFR